MASDKTKQNGAFLSLALQIKEVHLAGLYTKFKISAPNDLKPNPATVKIKMRNLENFLHTKNKEKIKMEKFNTILKHLRKLVKNLKTHCYVFFSLVTFHI